MLSSSTDNEVSSRSHTIFRMVIESTQRHNHTSEGEGGSSAALPVRTAMLNLVDLAGSENAVKAGSSDRRKETGYINRSLLTLGHVIWKLSEKSTTHIPYR
jgi:centromeric protein E